MTRAGTDIPAILFAGIAMYLATAIVSARISQGTGRTTAEGVFSAAQATRGDAIYARSCANCHGQDLTGAGVAPALTGADFAVNWSDLSLGDLFERIRIGMPADKPGSLSRQDNADVLAFMLFKAGFPDAEAELPAQLELLKDITFVARKK
jgi:mono/diheme cytochrome c family protein